MSTMQPDMEFEGLLHHIRVSRGFDFTGYKRTTLMRRFRRRMQVVHVDGFAQYQDYLEVHPAEFTALFNTILINVTGFFRDPSVWEFVRDQVIPRILAAKKPDEPIRVWSAGCASGEEAYTVAILLAEALGAAAFQERVKIYATDVDEEALAQARQAIYTERDVEGVPEELRGRYFDPTDHRFAFRKDLRRAVIFGRHDLLQDAPISRVDILVCRNTLMYFGMEAQARILARLHFALTDAGFLVLGRAEMLLTHGDLFTPVDLRQRVFVRVRKDALRDRLAAIAQGSPEDAPNHVARQVRLREAAFDSSPAAQIVVDVGRVLVLANERARSLLGLGAKDLGVPIHDAQNFQRFGDLRNAIERALADRRMQLVRELEWPGLPDDQRFVDVTAMPLVESNGNLIGASVNIVDVTEQKRLQREVEHTNQELETAYEELQSTNEELETTNEELQSTTEELETTNEELQSTNEELETMNEELQSTNEELETINTELRGRTQELGEVNAYLESVLGSLRAGVAVVDRELRISAWNRRSEDLWGVRKEEVDGEHILNLDIGLPVEQLRAPIRSVLQEEAPYREACLDATNRKGKTIRIRATVTPLVGSTKQVAGAIVMMEEMDAAGAEGEREDEQRKPEQPTAGA